MQYINGLFACCFFVLTSTAPQKIFEKFPFPAIRPDLPPHESATPVFVFDGLDYDELPEKLRNKNNDCYEHYFRCIRNRNHFHVVCTYDWRWREWGYYYSQCEIDIQNCFYRTDYGVKVEGEKFNDDVVFFSGERYDCTGFRKMLENHI